MNKKIIMPIAIALLLSLAVFVSAECIDSDEGESFFIKGETAVANTGENTKYSFDHCFQNTLSESVCVNGDSTFVEHKCPNECFDGFCLEDNEKGYVLNEKNELTASLGGKSYTISVHDISSNPSGTDASFSLKIKGDLEEITDTLVPGESQVLSNGVLIKVTDTDAIRMYGTPASVTFTLTDDSNQNSKINPPKDNNQVNQNSELDPSNNNFLVYWVFGIVVVVLILIILFLVFNRKK